MLVIVIVGSAAELWHTDRNTLWVNALLSGGPVNFDEFLHRVDHVIFILTRKASLGPGCILPGTHSGLCSPSKVALLRPSSASVKTLA